jgi:thiamine pyrophosphokinase
MYKLPHLIHGDLDSITPETRRFYEEHRVPITKDDDQYCTVHPTSNYFAGEILTGPQDFKKCMLVLTKGYIHTDRQYLSHLGPAVASRFVVVMSSMSGRIDQALGLLHEMLRESLHPPSMSNNVILYFLSESSISFVLPPGRNVIRGIDPAKGVFEKHAGILPIYGPSKITIEGFEWDVADWETSMGGNVSTSNHVVGDRVVVEVEGTSVLFTIELAETKG